MERIPENSEENYLTVLARAVNNGEITFLEAREMYDNYHAWHETDPEAA